MWKFLLDQTYTLVFRPGEFSVLLLNGCLKSFKC